MIYEVTMYRLRLVVDEADEWRPKDNENRTIDRDNPRFIERIRTVYGFIVF